MYYLQSKLISERIVANEQAVSVIGTIIADLRWVFAHRPDPEKAVWDFLQKGKIEIDLSKYWFKNKKNVERQVTTAIFNQHEQKAKRTYIPNALILALMENAFDNTAILEPFETGKHAMSHDKTLRHLALLLKIIPMGMLLKMIPTETNKYSPCLTASIYERGKTDEGENFVILEMRHHEGISTLPDGRFDTKHYGLLTLGYFYAYLREMGYAEQDFKLSILRQTTDPVDPRFDPRSIVFKICWLNIPLRQRIHNFFNYLFNYFKYQRELEYEQAGFIYTTRHNVEIAEKNLALAQKNIELEEAYKRIEEQNEQLKLMATNDSLTKLANRRGLEETADILWKEHYREKNFAISILMIDIDHFKNVNDTYGHKIGDQALVTLAQFLQEKLRRGDIGSRWGGEEFVVVLPNTPIEEAKITAERLRGAVAGLKITAGDGQEFSFTISIGIASGSPSQISYNNLISKADKAMYTAKNSGRNQVVIHPDS